MMLAKMLMLACAAILSLVASAQAQCYDKPPPNYTCELQKKWGKCYEPWMIQGNYCAKTCSRCGGPSKDDVWKPEKAMCYVAGNYYKHGLYVKCPQCVYNFCQCCDGTWLNCRDYLTGKEDPWC